MPADCLSGEIWQGALRHLRERNPSRTEDRLIAVLQEIIEASNDTAIGRVLDRHAAEILG